MYCPQIFTMFITNTIRQTCNKFFYTYRTANTIFSLIMQGLPFRILKFSYKLYNISSYSFNVLTILGILAGVTEINIAPYQTAGFSPRTRTAQIESDGTLTELSDPGKWTNR